MRAAAAKALSMYRYPASADAIYPLFADAKYPVRLTAAASYLAATGAGAAVDPAPRTSARGRRR